jgi:hypothetical protein
MNWERWNKDNFILGLITGLISLVVFYYLLTGLRMMIIKYTDDEGILRPPAIQLITMLMNVIIFRLVIINLDREKTAKGILFITVLITLGYFYIFFKVIR